MMMMIKDDYDNHGDDAVNDNDTHNNHNHDYQ